MRGKYRLDEIGDGKDVLKFMQGRRTIVTIYIHEDHYSFLIIFGKKEREHFGDIKTLLAVKCTLARQKSAVWQKMYAYEYNGMEDKVMKIDIDPNDIWYHGSNQVFSELREGSTITQWRALAEAFSHQHPHTVFRKLPLPLAWFQRSRQNHPALFINGENNPFGICAELKEKVPFARIYEVKGAGHRPHFVGEQAKELNQMILDFFHNVWHGVKK